jgi:L-cysteine:1D-myo-inositol 2-amino-2-deoxy-alpha-D-glucopyranoside ligase
VRIRDTATGVLATTPAGATAKLWVCGITPYDATHLGHAATYLIFDVLHRAWLDQGRTVRYAQNVTDVDDPLLERAAQTGEEWAHLAQRETAVFRSDMAALRILPPTTYAGVVESMESVIELIVRLRERGATYELDGDLYFPVAAAPRFGRVCGLSQEQMLDLAASRGGDPARPGKKDPLDALLWRARRPGQPSWDSPFGPGRPGWHVECAALALRHLGSIVDVEGGGSDLAFPHHEFTDAQAQVATGGQPFARVHVHHGMLGYRGEKMSKSLGNLVLVSELIDSGADPATIRLALLDRHYAEDWEWTDAHLARAARRLDGWRAAATRHGPPEDRLLAEVRAAVCADLDTPAALAAVDDWAQASLATGRPGRPATVIDTVDALLGIRLD